MRLGFKGKILVPVITILILAITIQLFIYFNLIDSEMKIVFKSKGVALAKSLSASVQDTILNRDASSLQGFIDHYKKIKHVSYVYITNEKGEVIAHTFSPSIPEGLVKQTSVKISGLEAEVVDFKTEVHGRETLAVVSPILAGLLGKVHVGMDIQGVRNDVLIPTLKQGASVALTIILVEFVFLFFILSRFINPILAVTRKSKEIVASKNLDSRIEFNSSDEIGDLVAVFNQLISELRGYTDSLEEKVNQRTGELNKSLKKLETSKKEQEELYRKLMDAARHAGMAEVATNVLHNVGNILNSLNISTDVFSSKLSELDMKRLQKLSHLLESHRDNLGEFFASDPKAQKVPEFLSALTDHYVRIVSESREELESLAKNVEHIRQIVSAQQGLARSNKIIEKVDTANLIRQAVQIEQDSFKRHAIEVDLLERGELNVVVDPHELLQVFVNLLSNARNAVSKNRVGKTIIVEAEGDEEFVRVAVIDDGIGISAENLDKIFEYGFTTRKEGHGFGLHSSANVMREMGGRLEVKSEGLGKGAVFTVYIPRKQEITSNSHILSRVI